MFLEFLGARDPGLRLTLCVPNRKGMLAAIAGEIARLGGDIVALGSFQCDVPDQCDMVLKVRDVERERPDLKPAALL